MVNLLGLIHNHHEDERHNEGERRSDGLVKNAFAMTLFVAVSD